MRVQKSTEMGCPHRTRLDSGQRFDNSNRTHLAAAEVAQSVKHPELRSLKEVQLT